ncbi:AraC family transcriptional regulator [Kushneria pakistanensis]|uniref:AraC family transcriptional regulator n=1 Tax=Kushneria pakistanensis TaxID=1508770 RepID=A0ABQ3FGQ3_9GAMM|nr:helix-turn-helix domain-containing protein [Kushneria pakistanensis]GHC23182.1 AraC family transcriptional regulator [Kushneria pakistanensis]
MSIQERPPCSPVLSRLSCHRTDSIEQHIKAYQGWDLQLMQLSRGRFEGQVTHVELEGVRLVRDHSSQALLKRGGLGRSTAGFSFPLSRPDDPLICQGRRYTRAGVLAVMGDNLPEVRVAANLDLLSLSLDYQKLAILSAEAVEVMDSLRAGPGYLPAASNQQALTLLFDMACQWLALRPDLVCRHALRDAFLGHVLDVIERGPVERVTPSVRKRVVDRAREVIDAQQGEPIAILSVCHRIGVSRRKLQYCFQEYLDISPASYVRLARLNAVHRTLARGAALRVQDEAVRWGFFHLGHFALEYRRLFGERPSETLQRGRQNSAESG